MLAQIEGVTLTIPYPSYIPRARGVHAVGKFGAYVKVACSNEERLTIQEAAHKLGIPVANFVRWCATEAAKQVLADEQRKEDNSVSRDPQEP